jgi:hypothetical protein
MHRGHLDELTIPPGRTQPAEFDTSDGEAKQGKSLQITDKPLQPDHRDGSQMKPATAVALA